MAEHKGSILVVDDEMVVLKSCERVLRPEGFEVDAVASPAEGLERVGSKHYDLIITDIMMPGMSGLDFIRRVRQRNADINVVMITGYPSQESIREALSLRIVDYLPKPFSPALLLEVTQKAVALASKGTQPEPGVEEFTEEIEAKLDAIIDKYRGRMGALIPVLEEAQETIGYLPPVVQRHVARALRLPVAEVHGVVSFYHFFSMKPKGKHNIKICLGTACYVKRAEEIAARLKESLGIDIGGVTEDRKFSLESVRCLGACGLAPVVVVDHDTYGSINPVETHKILENYQGNGGASHA